MAVAGHTITAMADSRPGTVRYDVATCTWVLYGRSTAYGLRLAAGSLWHVWWGPALALDRVAALPLPPRDHDDILGEELPGEGGERFGPPSLQVARTAPARSSGGPTGTASMVATCASAWPIATIRCGWSCTIAYIRTAM